MHLLVVEDNLINQQVARELLRGEGATVVIAANGQLGVDAVASADPPFHAVLMDLQMPVMDGYAATQAIRQELGLTRLPIIAMTANAMASDREACLRCGMDDHLGKPFELNHLVEVLQNHTRRAKPPAGLAQAAASLSVPAPDADATAPTSTNPAPDVYRVDTQGALARLDGNTGLYGQILQTYLGDLAQQPAQFAELLRTGEAAQAIRLMHTLKGVSGTVGALHLSTVAAAAEADLKRGVAESEHSELCARLSDAVNGTIGTMTPLAEHYAAPTPSHTNAAQASDIGGGGSSGDGDTANGAAIADLAAHLTELRALLAGSDLKALDVHARLLASSAIADVKGLAELEQAIRNFDFAQGVAVCDRLLAALG